MLLHFCFASRLFHHARLPFLKWIISPSRILILNKIWLLISVRISGPMPQRPSAFLYWNALRTPRSVSTYDRKHLSCVGDERGGDRGGDNADETGGGAREEALVAGEPVDSRRPELVSIWKRRSDVTELMSTLSVGVSVRAGGGCPLMQKMCFICYIEQVNVWWHGQYSLTFIL